MVSTCYLLPNGTVCKQYDLRWIVNRKRGAREHLSKELSAFKLLKGIPFVPQLLQYDDVKKRLYMTYCGKLVTRDTLPTDWISQCDQIGHILTKRGVYHNDIFCKNICVKDNKLHLVDFGLWDSVQRNNCSMIHAIRKTLLS